MKKQSIYKYYYFGTCLRYLQDAEAGHPIKGDGFIIDNIDEFFRSLDELGLNVTQRVARGLKAFRQKLLEKKAKKPSLSQKEAEDLGYLMDQIRITLDAEITQIEAFSVTPKIFDTDKLLGNVDLLFAPNVFEALPNISAYDFSEAGKCIAFERPTAAAFHILRGTESVLRLFYCNLVLQKRVTPLLWANMVEDLRTRQKTKKYGELYDNLDNIRLHYRNPTQHPDKIYDINEVQDLWPLCTGAINRMMNILKPE